LNDGEKARFSNESLNQSLWAGERLELEKAGQGIERRKTAVTMRVVDVNGNPVPGAVVTCKQTGHAFWFGAFNSASESEGFRRRFEEIFNFTTVARFYWERFEPEEKRYRWSDPDEVLEWLASTKITPKGHPLIWFTFHTPRWIQKKPSTCSALTTRTRGRSSLSRTCWTWSFRP
jgi:GH35 family endo-1,4-beta-xylanase